MWATKVMDVLAAVERVLLVSILTLAGTLAGLIITGVLPATKAAFAVIQRQTVDSEASLRTLTGIFYVTYRQSWKPLLPTSLISTVVSALLLLDWYAVVGLHLPLLIPLVILTPYYAMVVINLLLVDETDSVWFQRLKQAMVLPFACFKRYIGVLAIFVIAFVLSWQVSIILNVALTGAYLMGLYYALPASLVGRPAIAGKEGTA